MSSVFLQFSTNASPDYMANVCTNPILCTVGSSCSSNSSFIMLLQMAIEIIVPIIQITITLMSILGIICNLTLLPLIIFKSSRSIGSYKVLLFCYSSVATVNAMASVLTVPIFESTESGWVFYATVNRIQRDLGSFIICIYSATYINLVIVLTYSFVYRYLSMCRQSGLLWFQQTQKILLLVLLFLFIYFGCSIPLFLYTYQNVMVEAKIFNVSRGVFNLTLANIAFIGVPIFDDGILQWKAISLMGLWIVVMNTAFTISAICSYKILQTFKNTSAMANLSNKTKALHYKLFLLLAYQTLIPMIFEFIPIIVSYVLSFFGLSFPLVAAFSSVALCIPKCIDPILIILFITDYRRGFCDLFNCSRSPSIINSNTRPSSIL